MNFRDYLQDIPLKSLIYIAEELNVNVEYNARLKLVNAVDRAYWDGSLSERIVFNLDHELKTMLSMIVFSFESGVLEKDLAKKLEKTIGAVLEKLKQNIDILMKKGVVGGVAPENPVYFTPGGPAEQIRVILRREFIESGNDKTPSGHGELLEDFYSVLALIYKETLPLTLTGKAKKSILERAFISDFATGKSKEGFTGEILNSFIIEYFRDRSLITENTREFITTSLISGWLEISMRQRLQDIVTFALTKFLQDDNAIIPVAGILSELKNNDIINLRKWAYFLHSRTTAHGGFTRIHSRLINLMIVLKGLGLFSRKDENFRITSMGLAFFRNEKLPMDDRKSEDFITQPNFEIIVGPELDPKIRFRLELMTSRINRDMVHTYKINREGVIRARERGMSSRTIMEFFDRHSKNNLPQNVKYSIESWCNDYGSIYFEDAILMRFKDEAICGSVLHIPEISSCIKERLSGTILSMKPESIGHATAALKRAGFHPELYGGAVSDPVLSGKEFYPVSISKLLEIHKIPEINNKYISPGFTSAVE